MLIDKTLRSRYKIIKKLGSGGFGDTYLAIDIDLPGNPHCVVKHLRSQNFDSEVFPVAKNLFEREAEFLYRLGEHDRIPRLYAHFEEEGEFYLVQEFIEGTDLSEEILSGKPWTEEKTIQLLQEILDILVFVHQKNVIHRDIKPANIIRRKLDSKLVLIDFGAVKSVTTLSIDPQGKTNLTVAIGSPGYMPSEQSNGRPKLASDIYAVGMLGIQALTGVNPNELKEDPETGEIIWRDRASQVSDRFADVLDTMIRDHFSQRYQNASEASIALDSTVISPASAGVDATVTPPPQNSTVLPPTNVAQTTISPPHSSSRKFIPISISIAVVGLAAVTASFFTINNFLSTSQTSQGSSSSTEGELGLSGSSSSQTTSTQTSIPQDSSTPQTTSTQTNIPQDSSTPEKTSSTTNSIDSSTPTPSYSGSGAIWRSRSGKTVIPQLDRICWGNSKVNSVQTVFGSPSYVGTITFDSPKNNGCYPGDTIKGYFNLYTASSRCQGIVTVTWKMNNNAYIKWDINNSSSTCPVNTAQWEINTYPVARN